MDGFYLLSQSLITILLRSKSLMSRLGARTGTSNNNTTLNLCYEQEVASYEEYRFLFYFLRCLHESGREECGKQGKRVIFLLF